MIKNYFLKSKKTLLSFAVLLTSFTSMSQTNVYDDVIAISPNHTSLTAAINTAGLQGALQNPSGTLTVFAPDNNAFDDLAAALNTNIAGLLALPNLSDILLYHVLGITADAASITNGQIVQPLNPANTIKLTKTSGGAVYANQAMVNAADLAADNGLVHSIDAVILPTETVVDIAIDNSNFTSLVTAVVTAELLPALTDPLAELTVFAPTNMAFDNLATQLSTDINGILALPNLSDILLYHVTSGTVLSTDLTNGPITMLNSGTVDVDLTSGVMVNTSNVTTADLTAGNGVVHVIDKVLIENTASIESKSLESIEIFPNPTSDFLTVRGAEKELNNITIFNANGQKVLESAIVGKSTTLNVKSLENGYYTIKIEGSNSMITRSFLISSNK